MLNTILITDDELCNFLGSRIRSERFRLGLSQEKMAINSGIPLRTYKRFEQNGKGSTVNLIKIMRALDRLIALQLLFPAPVKVRPNYIQRLEEIAKNSKNR